ncbi:MAG: hypothetical protein AB7L09_00480 [Nitrospira sp.]
MPKKTLPPGWPDPYDLLRDPDWAENYPKLLLRAIYDIMKRSPGDVESKYLAGFNIGLYKLTTVDQPRFFPEMIKKGVLTMDVLTSIGKEREAEVAGLRELSPKSVRKYGKKSRSEMARDTDTKLKELSRLLNVVRATTTEEGMPPAGASL